MSFKNVEQTTMRIRVSYFGLNNLCGWIEKIGEILSSRETCFCWHFFFIQLSWCFFRILCHVLYDVFGLKEKKIESESTHLKRILKLCVTMIPFHVCHHFPNHFRFHFQCQWSLIFVHDSKSLDYTAPTKTKIKQTNQLIFYRIFTEIRVHNAHILLWISRLFMMISLLDFRLWLWNGIR